MAVGDDLRRAQARFLEAGVEAVDIDEDVAIDADAARDMRGEFRAEFVRVEIALSARTM